MRRPEVDVHLGTLQLQAAAPTGTAIDLQLPFGRLITRELDPIIMGLKRSSETALGDLELRARQSADRWIRRPNFALTLGAVLPTGPYSGQAGGADYLTLGRGVLWWIAELDARIDAHPRVPVFGQLSARGPLGRASDGFEWGEEVRATAGARAIAIPARLSFVVASDLHRRGIATEPDEFNGGRTSSANTGSWQWTVSPSVVIELGGGLSVSVGARIRAWSYVRERQLVPDPGGFVAISYAYRRAPRRRRPPPVAPAPGQLTVVDYWATWCAPCAEIERRLADAARRWPDVKIVRVDATAWPGDGAPALPGGATGLPVIEIFDERGARLLLLLGADAQRVVEHVDALRAKRNLSPQRSP